MSDVVIVGQHEEYVLGDSLPFWAGQSSFYMIGGTRVYKKFAQPRRGPRERACISKLVEIARMPENELHAFFQKIAWPLDYVLREGRVEGVVLPRADKSYFDEFDGYDMGPRPLANLMEIGAATTPERLKVLADLAAAFIALEYLGLVHGDLSENNATWRLSPRPSLLVLDCDGLRRMADPPRGEATPDWRDPRLDAGLVTMHDQASDRWALGLVVWRVLVADLRAVPPINFDFVGDWPPLLMPHLRAAFAQPLGDKRPGAKDWYPALRDTALDDAACDRLDALLASLRDDRAPRFTPTESPPSVAVEPPRQEAALNRNQLDELLRASLAARSAPVASNVAQPQSAPKPPAGTPNPPPDRRLYPRPIEYDESRVWSASSSSTSRRNWGSWMWRVALFVAVVGGGAPWALGDTDLYARAYEAAADFVTDLYTTITTFMETGT